MESFYIKKFDKQKFFGGVLLVTMGLLMPSFISVSSFKIPQSLLHAIREDNPLYVLVAGLKLVSLNSLRAFPHYIGAFFIGESIELDDVVPFGKMFKSTLVCVIIPVVYFIVARIHNIKYDFGVPALVVIILLILLGRNDYNYVGTWKKTMLIIVFLTAFQFFDIMPSMSRIGLPVGRGDTSRDVKLVSDFLVADAALDFAGTLFLFLLLFVGALLFLLIRDENNLRAMTELQEKTEKMEMDARMKSLENRTYMEMKNLVHDLKSPLTSAQALVGVVRIRSEQDGRQKEVDYLSKIEYSIDKLSSMISEILYENYQSEVTTEDVLKSVLAQISISDYSAFVKAKNNIPHKGLYINKIRIVRALINLIENSFYAIEEKDAQVDIVIDCVKKDGIDYVAFTVSDNGKGISKENLFSIWETGFSTRSSHGLGLSFVKSVVDSSGGRIEIDSKEGRGTSITLLLPEEGI